MRQSQLNVEHVQLGFLVRFDKSPVECKNGYYSTEGTSQCLICPQGRNIQV